jgi:O-antigen ligase
MQNDPGRFNGVPPISRAIDLFQGALICLMVGVVPLLVNAKTIPFIAPQIELGVLASGLRLDIFSYYKWLMLLGFTALSLLLFLAKITFGREELRPGYWNLPILLLVLLTLASVVHADYIMLALVGMYNRHEGAITYLCYFALFFVATNTNFPRYLWRWLTGAMFSVMTFNLILGLYAFYGGDLLANPFVKSLLLQFSQQDIALSGVFNSTLHNPNYVSGFAAAATAYAVAAVLLGDGRFGRLVYGLMAVFGFSLLLVTLSSSGFVSLAVVFPLVMGLALRHRKPLQVFLRTAALFVAFGLAFIILGAHNDRIWQETFGFFPTTVQELGQKRAAFVPEGEFDLPDPAIAPGTGRLYIWQKTVELIKERPVWGYGFDTFPYYFPQNDKNKIANLGSYHIIVTKPHNMYLNLAFSAGIFALFALLGLMLVHFYHSIRLLIMTLDSERGVFQAGLLVFWVAFSVQFFFNESIIGTSIIFWVFFGLGISLNQLMAIDL